MTFLNNEHLKYLKVIINKIDQIKSLTVKEHQILRKYQKNFNIKL